MFYRRAKIKRREDLADESVRRPSGLKSSFEEYRLEHCRTLGFISSGFGGVPG